MLSLSTIANPRTMLHEMWNFNVQLGHTLSVMLWSKDSANSIELAKSFAQDVNANFLLYTAVGGRGPRLTEMPNTLFDDNATSVVLLDTPLFESPSAQRFLFDIFAERTAGFRPISRRALVLGAGKTGSDTPYQKGNVLGNKMMHISVDEAAPKSRHRFCAE